MPEALASGVLAWTKSERQSDRYGAVYVNDTTADGETEIDAESPVIHLGTIRSFEGDTGRLIAIVERGRQSSHVGDFFHGLAQTQIPEEGERFVLGEGEFFVERGDLASGDGYMNSIGVRPDNGDEEGWWLDPEALYEIHDCTVTIAFELTS